MTVTHRDFTEANGLITNKKLIASMAEYIEYIDHLEQEWAVSELYFRGVSRSGHRLVPAIYRQNIWTYDADRATQLVSEFERRAKGSIERYHELTPWAWVHLMQHYGLPTRLLDWTQGSLIALYFAVRSPDSAHIPSVWVMDPYWLNEQSTGEAVVITTDLSTDDEEAAGQQSYYADDMTALPRYPIAVLPPHSDRRIVVQQSAFTIHGKLRDGFHLLAKARPSPRLAKLRLETGQSDYLKAQLYTSGISEATLFPDLEGLTRELRWLFGMK